MPKARSASAEEEYLKAVLILSEKGKSARTAEIAKLLRVAPASATGMVEKLAKKGYVKHSRYHGAILTPKGRNAAEAVLRRFQLLERFFVEYLKVPKGEAARQACIIEHCLSPETERRICQALSHPTTGMDERPMPKCRVGKDCTECMRDAPKLRHASGGRA